MNRRRQIPARDKRDRGFESFFLHQSGANRVSRGGNRRVVSVYANVGFKPAEQMARPGCGGPIGIVLVIGSAASPSRRSDFRRRKRSA